MDTIIMYDAVWTLSANPPSLNPHPNFFNIWYLRSYFAKALKKTPCPQPPVNGWAGAMMSPKMYILINQNPLLKLSLGGIYITYPYLESLEYRVPSHEFRYMQYLINYVLSSYTQ
jgi:hypothetical protein